uniref:NADH:ubiquinone reductase (H(+)-translocating) n=1 Tax=Cooperia oncophora TaxID=27828 RepID=A0A4P2SCL0_COOON|nr:NADH dehydrogenase subunit 5 [Cooperia oncophora]
MNILIYLILMIFFFMILMIMFMAEMKLNVSFVEWDFFSLKLNLYFNSLLFSFILGIVTLSVLMFSTYYLHGEINFNYYYFVLLIFVGSMFMLNYSNNVMNMLISWDLLGISSFFLVLFYNNWDSNSGAMNTALTNRVGDFFMFTFFSGSLFYGYYFLSLEFLCGFSVILLLIASFTKSAQFPFSSWLPKAMSAPTPVSSLVHSSTLVTAGLILLMNFSNLLLNNLVLMIMMLIGMFTMFFSSITALMEEDMKKVVALSTLSQMGFSMLTLGLGLSFVSFIHLISHALFKSCLFMQVGYLIHCNYGQQDGRGYGYNGVFPMFMQVQLLVTLFCLCGLFFSSGMVSKDMILELFFLNNNYLLLSFMFFISIFLTFGYSYRLWKSLFINFLKVINNYSSSFIMNFLSLLLVIFSVIFLWWINMNLLSVPTIFLYVDFFSPLFYIIMIVILSYFVYKILFKEFIYKFLVDYLAKNVIYKVKNLKFLDLWLNKIGFYSFNWIGTLSNNFNYFMSTLKYNNVIFLIFLIFLLL